MPSKGGGKRSSAKKCQRCGRRAAHTKMLGPPDADIKLQLCVWRGSAIREKKRSCADLMAAQGWI